MPFKLHSLYHSSIPSFMAQLIETTPMQRLDRVGMNCGCEYTKSPLAVRLHPYSRLDHSIGAALIVWHFTSSPEQTCAALFHDISTPCFAHTIDFMLGDYRRQEATEGRTEQVIRSSSELTGILRKHGISVSDVINYHRYPIADNDSPRLSSDRLEYSCSNTINYGIGKREDVVRFFTDIVRSVNEYSEEELVFSHADRALEFARASLKCSHVYSCDTDRYTMQILAELVRKAIDEGLVSLEDLNSLTEDVLIQRFKDDNLFSKLWDEYCSVRGTRSSQDLPRGFSEENPGQWRKLTVKKRFIDPYVKGLGRVTELFPEYKAAVEAFLSERMDYWICRL